MEAVVEQAGTEIIGPLSDLVSKVRSATARIFGCWHVNMSRPLAEGMRLTEHAACGARRSSRFGAVGNGWSFLLPSA